MSDIYSIVMGCRDRVGERMQEYFELDGEGVIVEGEWRGLMPSQVEKLSAAKPDKALGGSGDIQFVGHSLRLVCDLSELTERNIRYYIKEGLLAGPNSRGRDASYSFETIVQATRINNLKRKGRSTKEIRSLLDSKEEGIGHLLEALNVTIGTDGLVPYKCKAQPGKLSDTIIDILPGIYFGVHFEQADQGTIDGLERIADYIRIAILEAEFK